MTVRDRRRQRVRGWVAISHQEIEGQTSGTHGRVKAVARVGPPLGSKPEPRHWRRDHHLDEPRSVRIGPPAVGQPVASTLARRRTLHGVRDAVARLLFRPYGNTVSFEEGVNLVGDDRTPPRPLCEWHTTSVADDGSAMSCGATDAADGFGSCTNISIIVSNRLPRSTA